MNNANLDAIHADVQPVLRLLDKFKSKGLKLNEYDKAVVNCAYEYVVGGYPLEGLALLMRVNPDYWRKAVWTQAEQDAEFDKKFRLVWNEMMQHGYIPSTNRSIIYA